MAVRKPRGRTTGQGKSHWSGAVAIFWLVFIIVIIGIFIIKKSDIEENFNLFKQRLSAPAGKDIELPKELEEEITDGSADEGTSVSVTPDSSDPRPSDQSPSDQRPVSESQPPAQERPAPQPPAVQAPKPVETRDRNIYFIQIDNDGQILRSRVSRKIAVSDSPLHDALSLLLAGPSAEERNRGIISLIPASTRLLSAIVRGSTAYINFNEDFLFNTYGVEGYAAQLRQIVWTAAEFPTVNDVQILIEGRRVDYLGEGIWIGSPIDRQSF